MFSVTSVWLPAGGRLRGQVENEPPVATSSGIATSSTPWAPVWEPEMPVNRRSISDAPWPAGRGNLFALLLAALVPGGGVSHFC
jgi:hypothetical protein